MATTTINVSINPALYRIVKVAYTWGDDYFSIVSPKTGKPLVVGLGDTSDWSCLPISIVHMLGRIRDCKDSQVELSIGELVAIGELAKHYPDPNPTQPAPVVLVAPTAPTAPPVVVQPAPSQEIEAIAVVPHVNGIAPVIGASGVADAVNAIGAAQNIYAPQAAQNNEPTPLIVTDSIATAVQAATSTAPTPVVQEEDCPLPSDIRMMLARRKRWMTELRRKSMDKRPLAKVRYYFPSAVTNPPEGSGRDPMFADMAGRMKAAKFVPFDGSCYNGLEQDIPWHIDTEVKAWNARPEVEATRFLRKRDRLLCEWEAETVSEKEQERVRNKAFQELLDATMEIQESLLDSINVQAQKVDAKVAVMEKEAAEGKEGPTHNKLADASKGRLAGMSSAISAARKKLADLLEMAEAFDETESLHPLFEATEMYIMTNQTALDNLRRWHRQQYGK